MQQIVLVCITTFEMGGAERQALTLAMLLKKRGMRVLVAAFSAGGPVCDVCEQKDIPTIHFHPQISIFNIISIISTINRHNVDIIFSYCDHANIMMSLAFPFTHASKLFWGQRDAGIGLHFLEQFSGILGVPTAAISNSTAGRNFLEKVSGTLKIYHIPNAIQPRPAEHSRTQWRQRLDIQESKTVFLMVANLSQFKAHDLLLHAWALAQGSASFSQNAVLVLAGHDSGQLGYLRQLVEELHLEDSVIFAGQVSDISGLIRAADICVFSSRKEGLPNGILECMYHGLPVIALYNDGTNEACSAVSGNLLIKEHTPENLKEGLLKFFSQKNLNIIGQSNSQYVRGIFSPENLTKKYIDVIDNEKCNKTIFLMFKSIRCLLIYYFVKLKNKIL